MSGHGDVLAWDPSMVDGKSETCGRNTAGSLKRTTFGRYPAGWTSPSDAERSTVTSGQMVGHCQVQDSLKGCSNVRKLGVAENTLEGFQDLARHSHVCPDLALTIDLLQVGGWTRAPAWVPTTTSRIYMYQHKREPSLGHRCRLCSRKGNSYSHGA